MSKKEILYLGLITGFLLAAGSFTFIWPQGVRAEDELMNLWNNNRLWDFSYGDWWTGYNTWQTPSASYSGYWQDNGLRSGKSIITYSAGDNFFDLVSQGLSQGSIIYIPPDAPYFETYYMGSPPGGYLPISQGSGYSYATPFTPWGMYYEPYYGCGSLVPKTREELGEKQQKPRYYVKWPGSDKYVPFGWVPPQPGFLWEE